MSNKLLKLMNENECRHVYYFFAIDQYQDKSKNTFSLQCNISNVKSRVPGLSPGYVQAAAWVRTVQTVKLTDLHFPAPPAPRAAWTA